MSLTPSTMMALETIAPDFKLFNTIDDSVLSLEELKSDTATVIMFICNHCPFVVHVNEQLIQMANDYIPKGVSFIAISSNSIETHPQDGPDEMKKLAHTLKYPFPYLYDETQAVAKSYSAACTPDFYIFDGEMKCAYRGQLDDSRPGNKIDVTGSDIRTALDDLVAGNTVDPNQKPSIGCNIKWKSET